MSALSIHNLTKTYSNGVSALKGIDLEVKEGDLLAILHAGAYGYSMASTYNSRFRPAVHVFSRDSLPSRYAARIWLASKSLRLWRLCR